MERSNSYDNEASIDGIETGPVSQAEHRAQKAEMYQRKWLGMPVEVIEVEGTQQTEPNQDKGE